MMRQPFFDNLDKKDTCFFYILQVPFYRFLRKKCQKLIYETKGLLLGFSVLMETSGTGLLSLEELSSQFFVTVTTPDVLESLKSYTFPESSLLSTLAVASFVLLNFDSFIGEGYYQN